MIYHDQNKEDSRLLNNLENRARDLFECDREYSHEIFQTGVHLSRIDPETGYDDYDPRDENCSICGEDIADCEHTIGKQRQKEENEIYVNHDIGVIKRARDFS